MASGRKSNAFILKGDNMQTIYKVEPEMTHLKKDLVKLIVKYTGGLRG